MNTTRPTDRLPKKAKELFDTLPLTERKQVVVALANNHDGFVSDNVKIHGTTIYIFNGTGDACYTAFPLKARI